MFIGNDFRGLVNLHWTRGILVVVVFVEVAKGLWAMDFVGECCLIIGCSTRGTSAHVENTARRHTIP